MNILIIGASGFLGRHLGVVLKNDHNVYEASTKNCNLLEENSLNQFNSIKFDQIYHLAAWTQAGDFCLHHPGDQWIINQKVNTSVLSWWKSSQPQAKLICIGTSCSYDPNLPLVEDNYLKGSPIDSLFTYAMTKRMLLQGLISIQRQYKLKFLYLIPSTLYGPDYHTDSRQPHFIYDLIKKIYEGKYFNQDIVLWGNGYQVRELIYVKDCVDLIIMLSQLTENIWVNLGSGEGCTIRDFAKIIAKQFQFSEKNIKYDETKYVGAKSKVLSIEYLKSIVPSFTQRSLEEGIRNTIDWYRNFRDENCFLESKMIQK